MLCSWHGVTFGDGEHHDKEDEFPAELDRFKKIQIDVQGNKLSNFAEELCKIKKWNGGLVVTFVCDAILYFQNTFSAEGRRDNVYEYFHPCPDGNSSNYLGSDRCKSNADTDNSKSAISPRVISDTPS